ncbi:MAG: Xaa-Pro dipeptidase, partial [Gammaproteobacteria bacterium]|nr:Xaa-Pro dipeptidase [Gammaproteobacteria bacterium]
MKDQIGSLYSEHHQALSTRHAEALAATGYDTLVIYAGKSHAQFLDDSECPFRANPHFKTWVPLPQLQGSAIVFRPGHQPTLVYLQPRDYWHTPPADPDGYWTDSFDVQIVRDDIEVAALLTDAVAGKVAVVGDHTKPPAILGLGERNPEKLLARLHFD